MGGQGNRTYLCSWFSGCGTLPAQEAWALQIDFYVRKGAHFSVYLVLGMLLARLHF